MGDTGLSEIGPGQPLTVAGCAVVALILREFSRQAVAEQVKLKSQLEALVAIAIQPLLPADRIVLEAPDGLVVIVLGGTADALDAAERAQAGAANLPLCIAVNHGPVTPGTVDAGGGPRFVGDGLVSAVALANLATRGQLFVSRTFRDALVGVAPHRARGLNPVGPLTDPTLRTHELFVPDSALADIDRRRLLIAGGAAAFGILAAGVAIRAMRSGANQAASIQFEITPQGEIFLNGELKGTSPPLAHVAVKPGNHEIEVRNAGYAPLQLKLNLKPAEEIKVKHSFAGRKPARKEGDSYLEQLWRQLKR